MNPEGRFVSPWSVTVKDPRDPRLDAIHATEEHERTPKPPPPSPAPVRASQRTLTRGERLARQVAQALVDECETRQLTLAEFAALTGVGVSSVRAHRYGQGLRVDTLEKYARALGWRISIQDANGMTIGGTE